MNLDTTRHPLKKELDRRDRIMYFIIFFFSVYYQFCVYSYLLQNKKVVNVLIVLSFCIL